MLATSVLSRLQKRVGLTVSGAAGTEEGEEVERAAGGAGTLSVTMEIYLLCHWFLQIHSIL